LIFNVESESIKCKLNFIGGQAVLSYVLAIGFVPLELHLNEFSED